MNEMNDNIVTPTQITRDNRTLADTLSREERNHFMCVKRELLKNFTQPTYPILTLVTLVSFEYIRYSRALINNEHVSAATCVKNINMMLSEMKLTPASNESGVVSGTLSQILASIKTGVHSNGREES